MDGNPRQDVIMRTQNIGVAAPLRDGYCSQGREPSRELGRRRRIYMKRRGGGQRVRLLPMKAMAHRGPCNADALAPHVQRRVGREFVFVALLSTSADWELELICSHPPSTQKGQVSAHGALP